MKIRAASLDNGAFLNGDGQCGTWLHEGRIYKLFLTVDPQQRLKIGALHFGLS